MHIWIYKWTNLCNALIKKFRNVELYAISFTAYDGKISYNCGTGEETFEIKDFYPYNEEEKNYKDLIDCRVQINEKTVMINHTNF